MEPPYTATVVMSATYQMPRAYLYCSTEIRHIALEKLDVLDGNEYGYVCAAADGTGNFLLLELLRPETSETEGHTAV